MKNGTIEPNSDEITEKAWNPSSVPLSAKSGANVRTSKPLDISVTMSEIQHMGLIDKRPRYAGGKMSFESACIGNNATYSLDSAHRGGQFMRSKDGVIFRVGAKGMDAQRSKIIQVNLPEGD